MAHREPVERVARTAPSSRRAASRRRRAASSQQVATRLGERFGDDHQLVAALRAANVARRTPLRV